MAGDRRGGRGGRQAGRRLANAIVLGGVERSALEVVMAAAFHYYDGVMKAGLPPSDQGGLMRIREALAWPGAATSSGDCKDEV